jgi:hypothetical protein
MGGIMHRNWCFVLFVLLQWVSINNVKADLGFGDDGFADFSFSHFSGSRAGRQPMISLDLDPQNILNSSFRMAAREGRLKELKVLLTKGAEIDSRSGNGETALMFASRNCSFQLAEFLVRNGAGINVRDFDGRTPLIYAAADSCHQIVALFLKSPGVEVNAKDRFQKNALDYANDNAILEVDGPSQKVINFIQMAQRKKHFKLTRHVKSSQRSS